METTIPANTTATVIVPASAPDLVSESGRPAAHAEGVTLLRAGSGVVAFHVGSGSYRFSSPMSSP
jgi:alpha-L-rhamnosidase